MNFDRLDLNGKDAGERLDASVGYLLDQCNMLAHEIEECARCISVMSHNMPCAAILRSLDKLRKCVPDVKQDAINLRISPEGMVRRGLADIRRLT